MQRWQQHTTGPAGSYSKCTGGRVQGTQRMRDQLRITMALDPNRSSATQLLLPNSGERSNTRGLGTSAGIPTQSLRRWLPSGATLRLLLCGQLLSLLTCGTGVFSQALSDVHVDIPTAQNFFNYVLLAAVYVSWLVYTGEFWPALRHRWWKYALIALVDVEANFVIVLA